MIINKPEAEERHRRGGGGRGGGLDGEDECLGTRSSPREQAFSVDVGIHAVNVGRGAVDQFESSVHADSCFNQSGGFSVLDVNRKYGNI